MSQNWLSIFLSLTDETLLLSKILKMSENSFASAYNKKHVSENGEKRKMSELFIIHIAVI